MLRKLFIHAALKVALNIRRFKIILMQRKRNINRMIRTALKITRHIGKHHAGERITGFIQKSGNMVVDDLFFHIVHCLLIRFGFL